MKPYTRTYLDYFGLSEGDLYIPCEVCGANANAIHHLQNRKRGGSKDKDNIENLMAICASCHVLYADNKQHKEWLQNIHNEKMKNK